MVTTHIVKSRIPTATHATTQAIVAGDFIYLSGILALDPKTGILRRDSLMHELETIFSHIKFILSSQSLRLENLVKVTIYIDSKQKENGDSGRELHTVLHSIFGERIPAKTIVYVEHLPEGASVCIDGIAYIERD